MCFDHAEFFRLPHQLKGESVRRVRSTVARGALLAVGLMALAAPGASAKTVHKVFAGSFVPPVFGELTSFYPQSTDVHVGDSVKFAAGGFHTVTFLPSGAPRAPLFGQIPDTYGTELDAAGNPFWFSNAGLQKYLVNPDYFLPSASTTADGSPAGNSGAGFSKFTVTFSQLGTFKFFCAIHPKM